jgi:hypothetical protein
LPLKSVSEFAISVLVGGPAGSLSKPTPLFTLAHAVSLNPGNVQETPRLPFTGTVNLPAAPVERRTFVVAVIGRP